MKKPKILILIVLLVTFTILFGCSNGIKAPKSIENGAKEFIKEHIAMLNDPERAINSIRIIDSKITKLEKLAAFDDILDYPIELWNLEFKLKPNDDIKTAFNSGMIIEDGWITEGNDMGKSCLIFKIDGNNTSVLTAVQAREFDFNSLAKQEIRVRTLLANMNLLPNGAYEGNHIIIKFPVSKDENTALFLSQPVIQGDKGIWAVEMWKDEQGYIHHVFPGIDTRRTDIRIGEKYQELQDEFSSGEDLSLGDPIEVAISFIKYNLRQEYLRQIQVEVTDLEVIDSATMEDFVNEVRTLENE